MEKKSKIGQIKYYILLYLKGVAMGAADVVPGVSGGTIAFITGIYQKLLQSIRNINLESFKIIKNQGFIAFLKHINALFLVVLISGIGTSIFSLAKFVTYLLDVYPLFVWAFFFGLILASIWLLRKEVDKWNLKSISSLIIGAALAFLVTQITPAKAPDTLFYVFISGFIGICAMILPGISGSFILLLMGSYYNIMNAVHKLEIIKLIVFAFGAVIGITSFSRVLTWMLKKYRNSAIALLTGFMIGSIVKVWPWQNVLETRLNSSGKEVPFMYQSVLPSNYNLGDPQILSVIILMICGFFLIFIIEKLAHKIGSSNDGN